MQSKKGKSIWDEHIIRRYREIYTRYQDWYNIRKRATKISIPAIPSIGREDRLYTHTGYRY